MSLAAERDLVARQYGNGFAEVFDTADRIAALAADLPLGEAIVRAFLRTASRPARYAHRPQMRRGKSPRGIRRRRVGARLPYERR